MACTMRCDVHRIVSHPIGSTVVYGENAFSPLHTHATHYTLPAAATAAALKKNECTNPKKKKRKGKEEKKCGKRKREKEHTH